MLHLHKNYSNGVKLIKYASKSISGFRGHKDFFFKIRELLFMQRCRILSRPSPSISKFGTWSLSRFGTRSLSTQASIVHEQGNDIESIATWLMGLMPLCEFLVKTIWLSRLAMTLAIQMAFFLILTLASRTSRKIVPTSLLQTILSWTPKSELTTCHLRSIQLTQRLEKPSRTAGLCKLISILIGLCKSNSRAVCSLVSDHCGTGTMGILSCQQNMVLLHPEKGCLRVAQSGRSTTRVRGVMGRFCFLSQVQDGSR